MDPAETLTEPVDQIPMKLFNFRCGVEWVAGYFKDTRVAPVYVGGGYMIGQSSGR